MAIAQRFVLTNASRAKNDCKVLSCNVTSSVQTLHMKLGVVVLGFSNVLGKLDLCGIIIEYIDNFLSYNVLQ